MQFKTFIENLTFRDFIMRVFSKIRPRLIEILEECLGNELIKQRYKIIGYRPYQRTYIKG